MKIKKILKKTVLRASSLLFRDDSPKIVFYHDVDRHYTDMGTLMSLFAAHIEKAHAMGFHFVSDLGALKNRHELMICFDDGFRGIWDNREFFYSQSIFPTIFIAVDLIGREGYLSWDEIRELQKRGFKFESHTWSHRPLTDVPREELWHELFDARVCLSERLGREVSQLCYPCGMFTDKINEIAQKAGYSVMYSSIPGSVHKPIRSNVLTRNLVQFYDPEEYGFVLHGALAPFARRYVNMHYRRENA